MLNFQTIFNVSPLPTRLFTKTKKRVTLLVFILDYFQEKLIRNFSKNLKNSILGLFWALFAQIWAIMKFRGKMVCRYSNYLPLYKKS